MGAYLYSPAFAQLIRPLTILPWPVFVTVWTAFNLAIVWWLLGRWSLPAMLFIPIPFEIVSGNVHLMYAAAIVLGFRASLHVGAADPHEGDARDRACLVRRTPRVAAARLALGSDRRDRRCLVPLDPAQLAAWVDIIASSSSTPTTVGLVPPGRARRPPPGRHRCRRRRRADRAGVAAAGRRDPRAPGAVAELARDPRGVRAAVAGARRPRRRGAGIRTGALEAAHSRPMRAARP